MEHLAFVLWVAIWPVACSLEKYFTAQANKLNATSGRSEHTTYQLSLISTAIWIIVAIITY